GDDEADDDPMPAPAADVPVLRVQRAHGGDAEPAPLPGATVRVNRWGVASARLDDPAPAREPAPLPSAGGTVVEFPVGAGIGRAAYVAGTFDTKGRELGYLRQCLEKLGLRVVTVDLSTSGRPSPASVHPREV